MIEFLNEKIEDQILTWVGREFHRVAAIEAKEKLAEVREKGTRRLEGW